jgi:poly-gamma-glutamate synthesis protein (capsule biosynthesis protein)
MRRGIWTFVALFAGLCLFGIRISFAPARISPGDSLIEEAVQPAIAGTQEPRTISLSWVGDIMLAAGVGQVASVRGTEYLFAEVKSFLTTDDLTVGNLECAVATRGSREDKLYTFRADPALLPGLRRSGLDAVSVANNHTLDYGPDALLETLSNLRRAGIYAAGGGRNLASAGRPLLLSVAGQRVALVAASRVLPSVSWKASPHRAGLADAYTPARLLAEIRGVRGQADIVVVYLHWGKELAICPEDYQRVLARRCIDAGADLVVGSHPHVLQGFEYYRGKLIAYSLGNFVFTDYGKTTIILQTAFQGGVMTSARVIPCRILHYRPQPIGATAARADVLRALQSRSFGAGITDAGFLMAAG